MNKEPNKKKQKKAMDALVRQAKAHDPSFRSIGKNLKPCTKIKSSHSVYKNDGTKEVYSSNGEDAFVSIYDKNGILIEKRMWLKM